MKILKISFLVLYSTIELILVYRNPTILQATIAIIGCIIIKSVIDWSD